ncbi:MAG: hypothetical protein INR64_14735, partial [Caulobacteraceae bacterium]|nr:hypothetical protein [Caulobacter sp.]
MTDFATTAADPAADASARAAVHRRITALAAGLFDVPAAAVLEAGPAGWQVAAHAPDVGGNAPSDNPLVAEALRYGNLLNTARDDFFVVPDFDDDPRLAGFGPPDSYGEDETRLRFLAAVFLREPSAAGQPPAPRAARCLCLLDSRPRQLRSEDRHLLAELVGLVGSGGKTSAAPPAAAAV